MPDTEYRDFDVAIEATGQGRFRVRVIDSPSGQARGEFELPYSDLELENLLLKIGRPRGGTRRLESPEATAARDFGERLFGAVFAGDVGLAWQRSLDMTRGSDQGLRLRLRLADAPQLTSLPWEYLYTPTTQRHLVLSGWTPLVRYLDLPWGSAPLSIAPPLRIMAMVSNPSDVPELDVDAEWAKLDESLAPLEEAGMVEATRLDRATLRELQRAVRRTEFHIFHFIGHGGFDERAGDGVLALETETGTARKVTGRDVGTILGDSRSIRLAVLNSCEGARSSTVDPFGGAAHSLAMAGVPAVIAMQFEISDRAAIVFAHELYAAVADGLSVETALAEARRAIFGSGNDTEWGTPVLYLRADNGHLFDIAPRHHPPEGAVPPGQGEGDAQPDPGEPADSTDVEATSDSEDEDESIVDGRPEDRLPPGDTDAGTDTDTDTDIDTDEIGETHRPPAEVPWWKDRTKVGAAAALVGVGLVAAIGVWSVGGGDNPTTTTGGTTTTTGENTTITQQPDVEFVDSEVITAIGLPAAIEVDGDLEDWPGFDVAYLIDHVIYQADTTRQGEDSNGAVQVAYSDEGLHLAAQVWDETYSQPNTGDQIWRGDAVDIQLSTVPPGQASDNPDQDDFQVTLTPSADGGAAAHALFQGTGAPTFTTATTTGPIAVAGRFSDGWYDLEATIPWNVIGLDGIPSHPIVALFTIFDNDGEAVDGRSIQRTILGNVPQAQFQEPTTWGILEFG